MAELDRKNREVGFLLIDLSDPAKVICPAAQSPGARRPPGEGRRREGIPDVRRMSAIPQPLSGGTEGRCRGEKQ